MEKETIRLSNIKHDLNIIAKSQFSNVEDWRLVYITLSVVLIFTVGVLLNSLLAVLLFLGFGAYHLVCYIILHKDNNDKKKAIMNVIERGDVSISIEKLNQYVEETVYEPHAWRRHLHFTKAVKVFYFASGIRWRVPEIDKHYVWSKEYYISTQGLENITFSGDKFIYVSLQGYHDVAYIYPCKHFVLDGSLMDFIGE